MPPAETSYQLCPYCHHDFGAPIKRKKKCPACGETMLVRQGIPMTEDDAKFADWQDRLGEFGVTKTKFDRQRNVLSQQFGKLASVNDTIWYFLNQRVASASSYYDRRMAYFYMADIVRSEGRNPTPYLANAAQQELLEIKAGGYTEVEVFTANDDHVCDACRELSTRKIPIAVALAELPVPYKCTSQYGCRCSYQPVLNYPVP